MEQINEEDPPIYILQCYPDYWRDELIMDYDDMKKHLQKCITVRAVIIKESLEIKRSLKLKVFGEDTELTLRTWLFQNYLKASKLDFYVENLGRKIQLYNIEK
jgi:hypothetical protein